MAVAEKRFATYVVAKASADERSAFIRRTYGHLAAAIGAFALLEYVLLQMEFVRPLVRTMVTGYNWLIVLGLFMVVGWIADKWARTATSKGMQYAGLVLCVVAWSVIFLPLLYVASRFSSPNVIPSAGLLTLGLFGGLTGTVFITKKDFSFLRTGLMVASFVALGLIVAGVMWGFNLGTLFAVAMVGLAGGYILYYTSNIMHHYRTDQHVAASLALFAAVALMFWYILLLFMSRD